MQQLLKRLIETIFLVISLLFFTNKTSAQNKYYKIDEILIMKPGDISKGIVLDDSVEKLVNLLGNPSRIEDYYFEMEESHGKIYYYNKNKIYIINNKVFSYELLDSKLAFGKLNDFQIKVGDNIQSRYVKEGKMYYIKDFYPLIKTNEEKVRNLENYFEFVCNDLRTNKNVSLDHFFSILFSRDKVISIYLGD